MCKMFVIKNRLWYFGVSEWYVFGDARGMTFNINFNIIDDNKELS